VGSNFRGMASLQKISRFNFRGCVRSCPLYTTIVYISAGLIFSDSYLSAKTTKIGPHENFPLYGSRTCYSPRGGGGRGYVRELSGFCCQPDLINIISY
jgi:hypothetical protein